MEDENQISVSCVVLTLYVGAHCTLEKWEAFSTMSNVAVMLKYVKYIGSFEIYRVSHVIKIKNVIEHKPQYII